MDPISNVDQLVLLLRQRLTERSRTAGSQSANRAQQRGDVVQPTVDRTRALAAIEGLEDRQLKRAVIQNILADHFGGDLVNDAEFQQLVDRVTETIEAEDSAARLLTEVLRQLRAGA